MLLVVAIVLLITLPAPWSYIAVAGAAVTEVVEIVFWRWFLKRYHLRSGPELMVGSTAGGVERCGPAGMVRYEGALWKARSSAPLERGERVRIVGVEGLTVEVEPAEA